MAKLPSKLVGIGFQPQSLIESLSWELPRPNLQIISIALQFRLSNTSLDLLTHRHRHPHESFRCPNRGVLSNFSLVKKKSWKKKWFCFADKTKNSIFSSAFFPVLLCKPGFADEPYLPTSCFSCYFFQSLNQSDLDSC